MSTQIEPEPTQPSAADVEAAYQEWAKQHHKTSEEMQHLTDAEAAQCYHLALDFAMMRRWKATRDEDRKLSHERHASDR